jgi:hypothetical protein
LYQQKQASDKKLCTHIIYFNSMLVSTQTIQTLPLLTPCTKDVVQS